MNDDEKADLIAAIDEALLRELVRLRAENKRLDEKWREPGTRAWAECGRRQQLEHDLRNLLSSPPESQSLSGVRDMVRRILDTGARGPGHELSVPLGATEGAHEVLRVWRLPETGMLVMLDPNLTRGDGDQDPSDWGPVLHDVAKHVADYCCANYADDEGKPPTRETILAAIVEAFESEARRETATTTAYVPVD